MIQSIEEMFALLDKEGFCPVMIRKDPDTGFSRTIQFTVRGAPYYIEWYANVAHASVVGRHECYIRFTEIRVDTTWPSFRRGVSLLNHEDFPDSKDPVMRIASVLLDWQEKKP
jgi:hypothetical protein